MSYTLKNAKKFKRSVLNQLDQAFPSPPSRPKYPVILPLSFLLKKGSFVQKIVNVRGRLDYHGAVNYHKPDTEGIKSSFVHLTE